MTWLSPLEIGAAQGLLMVWVVLGFGLAYRLLSFPDLTVEGSLTLGAAVYASMVSHNHHALIAAVTAITSAALLGGVTAFLHVRFRLNKFLAGIIVVAISYSLTLRIMKGPNIGLIGRSGILGLIDPLERNWGIVGTIVDLFVICFAVNFVLGLFLGSRSGIRMRAAGSSPAFAESVGLASGLRLILGLCFTNGLAGASGILMSDYQGFADVGSGQGVLILALAALAIGEALMPQKRLAYYRFVLLSSIVGALIYHVIVAFAVRIGLAPTDLRLVTGVLVLVVVVVRVARPKTNVEASLLQ